MYGNLKEKQKKFLEDYKKICSKHNMAISACGCCDSPWVIHLNVPTGEFKKYNDDWLEDHIKHLEIN